MNIVAIACLSSLAAGLAFSISLWSLKSRFPHTPEEVMRLRRLCVGAGVFATALGFVGILASRPSGNGPPFFMYNNIAVDIYDLLLWLLILLLSIWFLFFIWRWNGAQTMVKYIGHTSQSERQLEQLITWVATFNALAAPCVLILAHFRLLN